MMEHRLTQVALPVRGQEDLAVHYQEVVVVHLALEVGHDVPILDLDDYKGLGANVGKRVSLASKLVPSLWCYGRLASKSRCSWNCCRAVGSGSSLAGYYWLGGGSVRLFVWKLMSPSLSLRVALGSVDCFDMGPWNRRL